MSETKTKTIRRTSSMEKIDQDGNTVKITQEVEITVRILVTFFTY